MSLIKRNDTVHYASKQEPYRIFKGRVHVVYGDRAVVRHKSEPHVTTIACDRLVVVKAASTRFAGAS